MTAEPSRLEIAIKASCEAGDINGATKLLLEGYGRELTSFLAWRFGDREVAREVFSDFSEDLWRGLRGFRWQCSARTWAYRLARHAAARYAKEIRKRRKRHAPLSRASAVAARTRTRTASSARTEGRERLARLREQLSPDDRMLLVLRVNRGLAWQEIALVMAEPGRLPSSAKVEKEVVRLRKRYQLAKERLRRLAIADGLVDPSRSR